jgi:hypothetical protein
VRFYDGEWLNKEGAAPVGNIDGFVLQGENTVWEDICNPLVGKKLSGVDGTVAYNYDTYEAVFQPSGDITNLDDVLGFAVQKPHNAKTDSHAYIHLHWVQEDELQRTIRVFYKVHMPGASNLEFWVERDCILSPAKARYEYNGAVMNQITELTDLDWYGHGMYTTSQIRLTRIDDLAGALRCSFCDVTYEVESLGTSDVFEKFA